MNDFSLLFWIFGITLGTGAAVSAAFYAQFRKTALTRWFAVLITASVVDMIDINILEFLDLFSAGWYKNYPSSALVFSAIGDLIGVMYLFVAPRFLSALFAVPLNWYHRWMFLFYPLIICCFFAALLPDFPGSWESYYAYWDSTNFAVRVLGYYIPFFTLLFFIVKNFARLTHEQKTYAKVITGITLLLFPLELVYSIPIPHPAWLNNFPDLLILYCAISIIAIRAVYPRLCRELSQKQTPQQFSIPQQLTTDLQDSLTKREQEILAELVKGKSNAEIAECCSISLPTVKTHISRILQKTDSQSRAELIARYCSIRPSDGNS